MHAVRLLAALLVLLGGSFGVGVRSAGAVESCKGKLATRSGVMAARAPIIT